MSGSIRQDFINLRSGILSDIKKQTNKSKKNERLITGKDFIVHWAGEGLAYRLHEPGEINCRPIVKTELFITAHNGGI